MGHIYVTGDKHGRFDAILYRIEHGQITKDDAVIVLGDAGINYYLDKRDTKLKEKLEATGVTFLIVRGNHEARPVGKQYVQNEIICSSMFKGNFIYEPEFYHILYMIDGETYIFNNSKGDFAKALAIGGAYSVDKYFRLTKQKQGYKDYQWFEDEQLSQEEMDAIFRKVQNQSYDYVLTHTVPYNSRPIDMFLSTVDQSTVDESMEKFLQKVHDSVHFKRWYAGHWHTDRIMDNIRFCYNDVMELGEVY